MDLVFEDNITYNNNRFDIGFKSDTASVLKSLTANSTMPILLSYKDLGLTVTNGIDIKGNLLLSSTTATLTTKSITAADITGYYGDSQFGKAVVNGDVSATGKIALISLSATGNVTATGNISCTDFKVDGTITGASISANNITNVAGTGKTGAVTGTSLYSSGVILAASITTTNNITANGIIDVTGAVSGTNIITNNSGAITAASISATGLVSSGASYDITVTGALKANGAITGKVISAASITDVAGTGKAGAITAAGNITATSGAIYAASISAAGYDVKAVSSIDVTNDISAKNITTTNSALSAKAVTATGDIALGTGALTLSGSLVAVNITASSVTAIGITAASITTAGDINAGTGDLTLTAAINTSGDVTGKKITANGITAKSVTGTDDIDVGTNDITLTAAISTSGAVTAKNITAVGITAKSVTATGFVDSTGADIVLTEALKVAGTIKGKGISAASITNVAGTGKTGIITATGNITASTGDILSGDISAAGFNVTATVGKIDAGNITAKDITANGANGGITAAVITASGNVDAGTKAIVATGALTTLNITAASVTAVGIDATSITTTGNIDAKTGDLTLTTAINTAGDVTAKNITVPGITAKSVTATEFVDSTGADIVLTAALKVDGTIKGKGISAASITNVAGTGKTGIITATGNITASTGDILSGDITATGFNVTATVGKIDAGNIKAKDITAKGANGGITAVNIKAAGNIDAGSNDIYATGYIDADVTRTITAHNITAANYILATDIIATGNVSSDSYIGSSHSMNSLKVNGTITGTTITAGFITNVTGGKTGAITASGNITANYGVILAESITATGFDVTAANNRIDVTNAIAAKNITTGNTLTAASVTATGNVEATETITVTNALKADGTIKGKGISAASITNVAGTGKAGNITATGDITASSGDILSGDISAAGFNVTATVGKIDAGYITAKDITAKGANGGITAATISASGNIDTGAKTIVVAGLLQAVNITAASVTAVGINAVSIITTGNIDAKTGDITLTTAINTAGDVTANNITVPGITAKSVTATGFVDSTGADITLTEALKVDGTLKAKVISAASITNVTGTGATGDITATGNVTATNGIIWASGIDATGFDVSATSSITATNDILAKDIIAVGITANSVTATGNVNGKTGDIAITNALGVDGTINANKITAGSIAGSVSSNASGAITAVDSIEATSGYIYAESLSAGKDIIAVSFIETDNIISAENVTSTNNSIDAKAVTGDLKNVSAGTYIEITTVDDVVIDKITAGTYVTITTLKGTVTNGVDAGGIVTINGLTTSTSKLGGISTFGDNANDTITDVNIDGTVKFGAGTDNLVRGTVKGTIEAGRGANAADLTINSTVFDTTNAVRNVVRATSDVLANGKLNLKTGTPATDTLTIENTDIIDFGNLNLDNVKVVVTDARIGGTTPGATTPTILNMTGAGTTLDIDANGLVDLVTFKNVETINVKNGGKLNTYGDTTVGTGSVIAVTTGGIVDFAGTTTIESENVTVDGTGSKIQFTKDGTAVTPGATVSGTITATNSASVVFTGAYTQISNTGLIEADYSGINFLDANADISGTINADNGSDVALNCDDSSVSGTINADNKSGVWVNGRNLDVSGAINADNESEIAFYAIATDADVSGAISADNKSRVFFKGNNAAVSGTISATTTSELYITGKDFNLAQTGAISIDQSFMSINGSGATFEGLVDLKHASTLEVIANDAEFTGIDASLKISDSSMIKFGAGGILSFTNEATFDVFTSVTITNNYRFDNTTTLFASGASTVVTIDVLWGSTGYEAEVMAVNNATVIYNAGIEINKLVTVNDDTMIVNNRLIIGPTGELAIIDSGKVFVDGNLEVYPSGIITITPTTFTEDIRDNNAFMFTVTGSVTGLAADDYITMVPGNRIEVAIDGLDNGGYGIVDAPAINGSLLKITEAGAEISTAYSEAVKMVESDGRIYLTNQNISTDTIILNANYDASTLPVSIGTEAYFNGVNAFNGFQNAIDRILMDAYTPADASQYEQDKATNSTYFANVTRLEVQTAAGETQRFGGNVELGALEDLTITTDDPNRIFQFDGTVTHVDATRSSVGDVKLSLNNAEFVKGSRFIGIAGDVNGNYTLEMNRVIVGELIIGEATGSVTGAVSVTLADNSRIGSFKSNLDLDGVELTLNSGATINDVNFSNITNGTITIDGCGIEEKLVGDGTTTVTVADGYIRGMITNVDSITVGVALTTFGFINNVNGANTINLVAGVINGTLYNVGTITVENKSFFLDDTAKIVGVGEIVWTDREFLAGEYTLATGSTNGTAITINSIDANALILNTQYEFVGSDGKDYSAFLFNNGSAINLTVVETDKVLTLDTIEASQDTNAYYFTVKAPLVASFGDNQYTFSFMDGVNDLTASFVFIGRNGDEFSFKLTDDTIQSFTVTATVTNSLVMDDLGDYLVATGDSAIVNVADHTAPVIMMARTSRDGDTYLYSVLYTAIDNFGNDPANLTSTVSVYVNGALVTITPDASGKYDLSAYVGQEVTFGIISTDAAGNRTVAHTGILVTDPLAPVIANIVDTQTAVADKYTFVVTADITDDIDVATAEIELTAGGKTYRAIGVKGTGDQYTFTISNLDAEIVGAVDYKILATDSSGNISSVYNQTMFSDLHKPSVDFVSIAQMPGSYTFEVAVAGSDNVGITNFELSVTDTNGNDLSYTISPAAGNAGRFIVTIDSEETTLGDLIFNIKATDAAGNTFDIDSNTIIVKDVTAPVEATAFAVAQTAGAYTLEFTSGTYTDNSGATITLTYAVYDGSTYIGDIYGDFTDYVGKDITVVETATDITGNKTTKEIVIRVADVTNPEVNFVSITQQDGSYTFEVAVAGSDNVGITNFELSVTDTNGNDLSYTISPAAGNAGRFIVTIDSEETTLGDLTFNIKATDAAGNTFDIDSPLVIVKDFTAPVEATAFVVAQTVGAYTLEFTSGTYTDNSGATATLTYAVYDGSTYIGDIYGDFTDYVSKDITVVETATDIAGNKTTKEIVIRVADVTNPDVNFVSITQMPGSYTFEVAVAGSDNVGITNFELSVTDTFGNPLSYTISPAAGNAGRFIVTIDSEETILGDLVFNIKATDAAGNTFDIDSNPIIVKDFTAPVITTAFAVSQTTDAYTLDFTAGTYTDNSGATATLTYAVYDGSTYIGDITGNFADYVGKDITVVETATDAAGNKTIQTIVIRVADVTDPNLPIFEALNQVAGSYKFNLAVSGRDNVAVEDFELTVRDSAGNIVDVTRAQYAAGNRAVFETISDFTNYATQALTFEIVAIDKAGNRSVAAVKTIVVADITAPEKATPFLVAQTAGAYTLDYTAGTYTDNSGNSVTLSYAVYDGATLIGDITGDFAAYAGKDIRIVETATDSSGNKTVTQNVIRVADVTDPAAPTFEIVNQNPGEYKFLLTVSGNDNLVVREYELTITDENGNIVENTKIQPAAGERAFYETTVDLSVYASTNLTFDLVAVDAAGNRSVTTTKVIEVIDVTPPEITATHIVQKKAERPDESGFNFNVFVTAEDNISKPEEMSYTVRVYSNLEANVAALYTFEELVYKNGIVNFELNPVTYDTNYWYTITAEDAAGNTYTTDFVAFTAAAEMARNPENPEKLVVEANNMTGTANLTGDLTGYKQTNHFTLTHSLAGATTLYFKGINPGEKTKITITNSDGKSKSYILKGDGVISGLLTNPGDTLITVTSRSDRMNLASYTLDSITNYFPETNFNSADSANQLLATKNQESGSATVNDWVGYADGRDYHTITSQFAGSYNITLTASTGKAKVYFLNEAGKTIKTMSVAAGQTKTLSNLLFESKSKINGENVSYIVVEAADKGKGIKQNGTYELTVDETVYNQGNNADDDWRNLSGFTALTMNDSIKNEWVGFGDKVDYRKIEIVDGGSYNLTLSGVQNKMKLTVYSVNSKGTLSVVKSATVNAGTASINGLLLDSNKQYYVKMEAVNASKAQNTNYDLTLSGTSFANQYNNLVNNNWNDAGVGKVDLAAGVKGEWVGLGDAVDYFELDILAGQAGRYGINLDLDVAKAASMTVYEVTKDANGVDKLTKVSADKDGLFDLAEGEYAIKVASADNGKGAMNTNYGISFDLPSLNYGQNLGNLPEMSSADSDIDLTNDKNNGGFLA